MEPAQPCRSGSTGNFNVNRITGAANFMTGLVSPRQDATYEKAASALGRKKPGHVRQRDAAIEPPTIQVAARWTILKASGHLDCSITCRSPSSDSVHPEHARVDQAASAMTRS